MGSSWCTKHTLSELIFVPWKTQFEEILNKRVEQLNRNINIRPCHQILEKTSVKNSLKLLHSKYVISPIDKASNNVAFICKRFYAQVLVKELGFGSPSNANPTYV